MKERIIHIGQLEIGEIYDRDDLFALCDWFVDGQDVIFGSVCNSDCFRAERDDIIKNKWVVKELWQK